MGNFNTSKFQLNNNNSMSKKSHSFFSTFGCKIKKSKKSKSNENFKSKSISLDESEKDKQCKQITSNAAIISQQKHMGIINHGNVVDIVHNKSNNVSSMSLHDKYNVKDDNDSLATANGHSHSAIEGKNKDQIKQSYPRLSECSLNSDDLMLSTDVNLDQADDDVSKDYNTSEKDDPFIYENIKNESVKVVNASKSIIDASIDPIADELERNDIVSFDSSRESSVSTQRKPFGKGFSLRPHSFSSPLRPNSRETRPFCKRNSNLSTVESIDLAWTWISTSETAILSQDISNLKLMLLKMKRLLLDETLCDGFLSSSRIDTSFNVPGVSSVFSEPNTPNCNNTILNQTQADHELPQNKNWDTMTKEMLIQELHEMHQQNGELQYQLKEKSRIIEFLQDQQQNYRNYPRRLHSSNSKGELPNRRIIRSSTFETASTLNNQTFNEDADFSFPGTKNTNIIQSESIHS